MLTDLADRLPYSAVRSTDYSLWKQFAARNVSLEAWADFGAQLAWLLREQLDHVVLSQGWDYAGWEARCGACSSSAEAGRLLREVEGEGGKGIDWKKVRRFFSIFGFAPWCLKSRVEGVGRHRYERSVASFLDSLCSPWVPSATMNLERAARSSTCLGHGSGIEGLQFHYRSKSSLNLSPRP